MMRLALLLVLLFGCSAPAAEPSAGASGGFLGAGGDGAAPVELDVPITIIAHVNAGEPVRFQLGANLCALLVGPASFRAEDSGYVVDGCQVFDNKQGLTQPRSRILLAEPTADGNVTVQAVRTDPWCTLSCVGLR
jgi:hypothetical protein